MTFYPFSFTYDMYLDVKRRLGRVSTWNHNKEFYLQMFKVFNTPGRKTVEKAGPTSLLVRIEE